MTDLDDPIIKQSMYVYHNYMKATGGNTTCGRTHYVRTNYICRLDAIIVSIIILYPVT